jgi:hypothetical protein
MPALQTWDWNLMLFSFVLQGYNNNPENTQEYRRAIYMQLASPPNSPPCLVYKNTWWIQAKTMGVLRPD